MFRCAECGHIGNYTGPVCEGCHRPIVLNDVQLEQIRMRAEEANEDRNYELAAECLHILADQGDVKAQREYATLLEHGEGVERDLDAAMKYFGLAAERYDGYAAFRYARLAERHSERTADFWLRFSAVLGCIEAFPYLADKLAREGDDENANYYYALAAACDHTDSIVTMAKRYYDGIGCEKNDAYAKWYLDRLAIPPIHAIKLAYRLRSVRAENPGEPKINDYDRLLRRLATKAHDCGFFTAYHYLCTLLSDRLDMQARMILGMLYAEGVGCEKNPKQALLLLSSAASHGNKEAAKQLGDIYLTGSIVEVDVELALENYRLAAKLGMTNAYESMGDVYHEGRLVPKDIVRAVELYDLAAAEGYESARAKATEIRETRERNYRQALAADGVDNTEAFRCYAISAEMGYVPAYKGLARCFELGLGTKKDRRKAHGWYMSAVENGDRSAIYPLALCYSRGIGVEFDFKTAVELLKMAKRMGSPEAEAELRTLYERKKKHMARAAYAMGMELLYMRKFAEAERVLIACLKAGHAKGIYTLGCINEFGLGVPTNRERAFKLYECSFDLGFRDPRAVYKLIILRMARNYKQ